MRSKREEKGVVVQEAAGGEGEVPWCSFNQRIYSTARQPPASLLLQAKTTLKAKTQMKVPNKSSLWISHGATPVVIFTGIINSTRLLYSIKMPSSFSWRHVFWELSLSTGQRSEALQQFHQTIPTREKGKLVYNTSWKSRLTCTPIENVWSSLMYMYYLLSLLKQCPGGTVRVITRAMRNCVVLRVIAL